MPAATSTHPWKVYRIGDLDQVIINSGADLLALAELDPKLWVALSCPVTGLELDERTLVLVDQDGDGRIRIPDILATIRWAQQHLQDLGELLAQNAALPLAAIKADGPQGPALLKTAREAGADTTVTLEQVQKALQTFGDRALNADGVVTAECTTDAALAQLINDIIATVGSVADRSGRPGVDQTKADTFWAAAESYVAWSDQGGGLAHDVVGAKAAAAIAAVRAKVDDYFARTRLAAFDGRATGALNRGEDAFATLAAKELTMATAEVAALPLATVAANAPLPLLKGVNPAWAGALVALHEAAVIPVFGAQQETLSEAQWSEIKTRVAPYETWQGAKAGQIVASLGIDRLRQLLKGAERAGLLALIAADQAAAPEMAALDTLERLVRLRRDFATLLRNFLNFTDFYALDRWATFQAGTLYLDSRSTQLCVDVADPGAHAKLATLSQTFLAYCDLKRAGCAPRKIAACMTQGHGDYLRVGRNGVFYDRKGRDWDATITLIIDNPISIRQAFWSPYKRVARFVEDQMTKFAAAKEKSADNGLAGGLAQVTTAPAPGAPAVARPAFDVAKFAGIFAAIGLALGAIGGAIAAVVTGFMNLALWQMPIAIAGALLVVSGPSMLLAALKLRQRTLGPILDANGWAINGRVKINIPFGTRLTERAILPPGAHRTLSDPYADNSSQRRWSLVVALLVLVLAAALAARTLGTWPFAPRPVVETPAVETPAVPPPATT